MVLLDVTIGCYYWMMRAHTLWVTDFNFFLGICAITHVIAHAITQVIAKKKLFYFSVVF